MNNVRILSGSRIGGHVNTSWEDAPYTLKIFDKNFQENGAGERT